MELGRRDVEARPHVVVLARRDHLPLEELLVPRVVLLGLFESCPLALEDLQARLMRCPRLLVCELRLPLVKDRDRLARPYPVAQVCLYLPHRPRGLARYDDLVPARECAYGLYRPLNGPAPYRGSSYLELFGRLSAGLPIGRPLGILL